jgi:hypothetical protein
MDLIRNFNYEDRDRQLRDEGEDYFFDYGDYHQGESVQADEEAGFNEEEEGAASCFPRATLESIAERSGESGGNGTPPQESQGPSPPQDQVVYSRVNFGDMVERMQTGSYVMKRHQQQEQARARKRRRRNTSARGSSRRGSSRGATSSVVGSSEAGDIVGDIIGRTSGRSDPMNRGDDSEVPGGGEDRTKEMSEEEMVRHMIENDKKKLRRALRSKQHCFGCRYCFNDKSRVSREHLDRIQNFYADNEGQMSDRALGAGIHEIYEDIRKRSLDQGIELPEWDIDTIVEHFKYHIIDVPAIINRMIRSFYFTFDTMRNSFFDLKQVTRTVPLPGTRDPATGKPMEATFTVTEKVPNTRNIRCADAIAKTIVSFARIGVADLAPERKRTQVKNSSPTLISPNAVRLRLES